MLGFLGCLCFLERHCFVSACKASCGSFEWKAWVLGACQHHSPAHSVVFVTHFSWTSLSGLPCIMNPQKLCAFQSWQILYKNRGHTY